MRVMGASLCAFAAHCAQRSGYSAGTYQNKNASPAHKAYPAKLTEDPGLPCSAAQAAGLAEGAGLQASGSQGVAGARPVPPGEPGDTGLVLGKRHQRMFKQAEDEFLLKYWVRWALPRS